VAALGDGGVDRDRGREPIGAAWWRFLAAQDPGYGFVADDVPELSLSVERANRAQARYLSEGFRMVSSGRDADTMVCELSDSAAR
jgi:hypothetical protein